MNNTIEVLEVLPNESPDAGVLRYSFFFFIFLNVSSCWAMYWNIVNVRLCNMRNFGLNDVGDVVMEDGN